MSPKQHEALEALATTTSVENGMGVSLVSVRALALLGYATVNEFHGVHDDAKRITHWNARITEAGRTALSNS